MKGCTTPPASTPPTLYEQQCGFFYMYIPQESEQWKSCETGRKVFRPYLRRIECLTTCGCHNKGSTFSSAILIPRPGFEPGTSRSADRRLSSKLTCRQSHWLNNHLFQISPVPANDDLGKYRNCGFIFTVIINFPWIRGWVSQTGLGFCFRWRKPVGIWKLLYSTTTVRFGAVAANAVRWVFQYRRQRYSQLEDSD